MSFASGPLRTHIRPGGIQLRAHGTVLISTGIKSTGTDNPAFVAYFATQDLFRLRPEDSGHGDASVGDRLKFGMNYNTDATFDFDSKNIKLQYDGTEDGIVRSIETR